MKKRRKKKGAIERPVEMEHPQLRSGTAYVEYRISQEQLRAQFGLDETWKMSNVGGTGDLGFSGRRGAGDAVAITFKREITGPVKAMQILAGEPQV